MVVRRGLVPELRQLEDVRDLGELGQRRVVGRMAIADQEECARREVARNLASRLALTLRNWIRREKTPEISQAQPIDFPITGSWIAII